MNHYATIKKVINHIVANKLASPSLEDIAKSLNMTSGHLQKVFVEWVGISPKQFSRYLRLQYSKELLKEHKSTETVTHQAGLSSASRLYDLFVDIEAMTPGEYQHSGENLTLYYSIFETKFGQCLVAATDKGICNILFADTVEEALADLKLRWTKATLVEKKKDAHRQIEKYFKGITPTSGIKFHLRGTNFQIKVWEALLSIPEGSISSYGNIAERVGNKKLGRAVGRAIGDNPVGYIIPCHRVLTSTGEISGYRWGIERKRAMLCYEAVRKHKQ